MGNWGVDQSKTVRRTVWGRTRGEGDATWKDFCARAKEFPVFTELKFEKIGTEIHGWRLLKQTSGLAYWASCLRFIDDTWGYWTLMYRTDERRWRSTPYKNMPIGRLVKATAEFYQENFK